MRNPENILQNLDWTVIRKLDGILQGDYRSLFFGYGIDLAELREYQVFDDVRYIDWNVTARLHAPYVRQFVEDREITAWFLLDLSPSLDFGTVKELKRDLLIDFAGILARLLTRHGNRIGAIIFSGKIESVIPPQSGKNQVLRLIRELQLQPQLKQAPSTDLKVLLDSALRLIKRRSLIVFVSDFISRPGWDAPLSILTQRHEIIAVNVSDPREIELPDMGIVIMEDAETGEQLLINTHDQKFRTRFIQAAKRRRSELELTFHHLGVDILELSTGEDLVKAIMKFAELRKKRKKSPASFAGLR